MHSTAFKEITECLQYSKDNGMRMKIQNKINIEKTRINLLQVQLISR